MINDYLRGRVCIEFVRGGVECFFILSFSLLFFLVLPFFVSFLDLAVFSASR
jgi:hypothetical protein